MSNVLAPNGFSLLRRSDGAQPTYEEKVVQLAYNNASIIAKGDPVRLLGSGYIDALTPAQALAGPVTYGIFLGVEYFDSVMQKKIWLPSWNAPATAVNGTVFAHVAADADNVFLAQCQNGQVVQGNIGQNINFINQSLPNVAGISTAGLDLTTASTAAALPFRIVGMSKQVGNDNTSAYNWVEVILNSALPNVLNGV